MSIYKKKLFDKCTMIGNDTLQRKDLSLAAKGLLCYMLSLPEDWDFSIEGISKLTGETTYTVSKLLKELELNGYHTKVQLHENGKIKDWIYYVFAEPQQSIIDKTFKDNLKTQDLEIQDLEINSLNKHISNKLDIVNNKTKEIEINSSSFETKKEDSRLKENVECIMQYLNESIGTRFSVKNKEATKLIKARFNEGYILDDFYDVIDKKVREWKNTEWEKYLRPSTLFGNKFDTYLNQKNSFRGKPKTSYSSKPSFDNTADHNVYTDTNNIDFVRIDIDEYNKLDENGKTKYLENLPLADMTKEQKEFYREHCLMKDENGNYLTF